MVGVMEAWAPLLPWEAQWQKPIWESEILPGLFPYLTDSCYYAAPSLEPQTVQGNTLCFLWVWWQPQRSSIPTFLISIRGGGVQRG